MTRQPRRNHTPAFNTKVALAAIKGEKALAELAQQFECMPTRSRNGAANFWRALLMFLAARAALSRLSRRWM